MKVGYLKEFVLDFGNKGTGQGAQQRGNPLPSPLGVIEVIHAAPRSAAVTKKGAFIIVPIENYLDEKPLEKKMKVAREPFAFNDDNQEGTI